MSQTSQLYDLLRDGRPHSTPEILQIVYGNAHLGIARIGARIWDVKKKYGVEIISKRDDKRESIWWYQMMIKPAQLTGDGRE